MTQLMDWVMSKKWVEPGGYDLSWMSSNKADRVSVQLGELELTARKATFYRSKLITHGGFMLISAYACQGSFAVFSQLDELRQSFRGKRRLELSGIPVTLQGDFKYPSSCLERVTGEVIWILGANRGDSPERFDLGLIVQGLQHSYAA